MKSRKERNEDQDRSYRELSYGSVFSIGGESGAFSVVGNSGAPDAEDFDAKARRAEGIFVRTSDAAESSEKYLVQEEIGRGGMAHVFEALDRDLKRSVAIKVITDSPLPVTQQPYRIRDVGSMRAYPQIRRFVGEARITGRLEHPGVVPIHDLGIDAKNRPFFTMKRINGRTLSQILSDNDTADASERFSTRDLLAMFVRVCNTVAFAHSRGVVHRDIKPQNIMVGEYGEVLVLDWGLAKLVNDESRSFFDKVEIDGPSEADETETREGAVLGTPSYMPPEQALGQTAEVDARSDVFALGAVLYEILFGYAPYRGTSIQEVIAQAAAANPNFPVRPRRSIREVARISRKAMSMRKEDRYQSVEDLMRDIEAFLDNRIIPDYHPVFWKVVLQNFAVVAGILLAILAVKGSSPFRATVFVSLPAVIVILVIGLAYQFLIHGLSVWVHPHRLVPDILSASFSAQFQNGAFLGGLYGMLIGIVTILSGITEPTRVAAGTAISLLVVMYLFPIFLVLRLNFFRKARKLALFEAISPFVRSELLKMGALVLVLVVPLLLAIPSVSPMNPDRNAASGIDLSFIVSRGALLVLVSAAMSAGFFRLVFSFREFFAAFSHFFSVLAGGEVSQENRVHAGAVLRFLSEVLLVWTSMLAVGRLIVYLASMASASHLLDTGILAASVGVLAMAMYVIWNLMLRHFLTSGGETIESTCRFRQAMAVFYGKRYASFWAEARLSRVKIILGVLALLTMWAASTISAGARLLSPTSIVGLVAVASIAILAGIQRRSMQRAYAEISGSSRSVALPSSAEDEADSPSDSKREQEPR